MSANTGTQPWKRAPATLPPEVQGVQITSSPGSGLMAPKIVWKAEVPEFTKMANLASWRSANSRSNMACSGPREMLPVSLPLRSTAVTAATSSSP